MTGPDIHLLLDLASKGESPALIRKCFETLPSADSLGEYVDSASVLVPLAMSVEDLRAPAHWTIVPTDDPLQHARAAFEFAADMNRNLLVLLGPLDLKSETAGMLLGAFGEDPHFGVSIPRLRDAVTGELLKVDDELGDCELHALPARVLSELPEYYILPELLTPCFLIRKTVIGSLPSIDQSFQSLNGALQTYLLRARRAGFRTVLWNRAAICVKPEAEYRKPAVPRADRRKLFSLYPDASRARLELDEHTLHRHESMLGRLYSSDRLISRTLLLDVRGMPSYTNGTVEAIFGLCKGLRSIDHDWSITLWASEEAAVEYHRLRERYPDWPVITAPPVDRFYAAAFRPSQPWYVSSLMELHDVALLNFYAMLDTISWDTLYDSLPGLEGCWDFMGRQADGLLYISTATRDHVERRFPAARSTPAHVMRLSCDPRDYCGEKAQSALDARQYTFVIGNSHDHKNLAPTIDLLSSAFPLENFTVLGMKTHPNPRVQTLESGLVTESEMEKLFAQARTIVFPSLYEGFGFPVLKGLSYGATVLARTSDLLSEIAAHYSGPGTLLAYSTSAELVDSLARVVRAEPVNALPLGTALVDGQPTEDWAGVAQGLLDFVEAQLTRAGKARWFQRASVIRQIQAFGS